MKNILPHSDVFGYETSTTNLANLYHSLLFPTTKKEKDHLQKNQEDDKYPYFESHFTAGNS